MKKRFFVPLSSTRVARWLPTGVILCGLWIAWYSGLVGDPGLLVLFGVVALSGLYLLIHTGEPHR